MATWDVVIAGGGIGGAVLANLLGRAGKRVLVLEKNVGPPSLVRPEGLWPATVERLRALLPAEADNDRTWLRLNGIEVHYEQATLLKVSPGDFKNAGVQLMLTDPNHTRELLLQTKLFELQRGIEVIGVLKEKERIVGLRAKEVAGGAEREFRAAWTIGDDGGHSRVREGCGIPLRTRMFPIDILCFGFDWPAQLPTGFARLRINKKRTRSGFIGLGAAPMPAGKGAALAPVRPWIFDDIPRAQQAWAEFSASDPDVARIVAGRKFPDDVVRVRRPWGHAARYGVDGAVLLGDAVHPVSPVGGQGANMSVSDAAVLAELMLSGQADFLAEYERRRRPANARSIQFTRRAAQFLSLPAMLADRLIPLALRQANGHPEILGRFFRKAATAFEGD